MLNEKLKELGLEIPTPGAPAGAYVHAVKTGNLVYTSGQLPSKDGQFVATGKVPTDSSLEQAYEAAKQAALNALGAIKSEIGDLDKIKRIIRINVFVNSAAGFTDQAKVANGASELLVELFGDAGKHTRCAVGMAELPLNVSVELDVIAEVE